jgi:DNA gyrase subunit B
MVLDGPDGQRGGDDLVGLVDHARRMRTLMAYVPRRYPGAVIEALALGGALDPEPAGRVDVATRVASWLNAGDREAKWSVEETGDGGYHLRRVWRGVTDHHVIDAAFVGSAEARKLHGLAAEEAESYRASSRLHAATRTTADAGGDEEEAAAPAKGIAITRPSELLEAIFAAGRKGTSISRYKGLGEMNAEQLWETTLDPSNRSMLKVEVDQADVADEIFTRLMGDVVEPRREFIQDNALSVANLDV